MSTSYVQRVNAATSTARQRLPSRGWLDTSPEQLEISKTAFLELAAALQGITIDQLLEEGGDAPDQRMGSTCCNILEVMLRKCRELDAPFFVFGAGYWSEVLTAVGHGIRAGGVEVVQRRAAALGDILEALEVSSAALTKNFSHLFREAADLATKRRGAMFDFIKERVVMKMNDVVFTPELRNRICAEFAQLPSGSVLFATTNYGTVDDGRLSPWSKVCHNSFQMNSLL